MKIITDLKFSKKKTKFSISIGEYKKFQISNNNNNYEYVLDDLCKKILYVLNSFFCITSNQLSKIVKINEKTINEKLIELENINLISLCLIFDKNDKNVLEFYFLDLKGKEFLEKNNISINEFNIRENNLVQIKKIL